ILILDSSSGQLDLQVADAAAAAVSETNSSLAVFVPSEVDTSWTSSLLRGDLSSLKAAGSGRSPWGARWILVGSAARQPAGRPHPTLRSLLLSMDAKLIDARTSTISSRQSESNTGRGATELTAVRQATERCLSEITYFLERG
ncbi:MAG: hypothetical protein AAF725_21945, partial [Acidobacteriota bacterium]